jgi:hypothetical protein
MGNSHNLVVGILEGKRLLGRPSQVGRIILKLILKEVGCEEMG